MSRSRTILLVEDDPDDEALVLMALRRNGLAAEIIVTHDGVEALDYLLGRRAYAGRDLRRMPQVVLLDVHLGVYGGFDVLRAIRADERTKLLAVVMLTSSDEEADIKAAYRLGVNSYVHKPADMCRFMDVVQQIGLFWFLINAPPTSDRSIVGAA